jgi:hypothetical protein
MCNEQLAKISKQILLISLAFPEGKSPLLSIVSKWVMIKPESSAEARMG